MKPWPVWLLNIRDCSPGQKDLVRKALERWWVSPLAERSELRQQELCSGIPWLMAHSLQTLESNLRSSFRKTYEASSPHVHLDLSSPLYYVWAELEVPQSENTFRHVWVTISFQSFVGWPSSRPNERSAFYPSWYQCPSFYTIFSPPSLSVRSLLSGTWEHNLIAAALNMLCVVCCTVIQLPVSDR